ncbi:MAG: peroxiredoxin [Acidimicrobiales bacterium]
MGDRAPDFELPDDRGGTCRLGQMVAAGPVVVYFYPAAMTPGCTREGCHFRDLAPQYAAVGAQRVGISPDPVPRLRRFSEEQGFDFPLLSDAGGVVARAYGARRRLGPLPTRRVTFVIGGDGVVVEVIRSEFRFAKHGDAALGALRDQRYG